VAQDAALALGRRGLMKALILSSFVGADPIGGGAQKVALEGLGFETALVPTVVFGRSPAKGGRGRATAIDHFVQMLEDIEAEGFGAADLVITGHFSLPEQVEAAAEALRRSQPRLVVVDPILGDAPKGLYIKPEVAVALEALLLPLAHWITPNAWELSHLTGLAVPDAAAACHAARQLEPDALVTSVPSRDGEIGLLLCGEGPATLIAHPKAASAPNGTGDLVASLFGAGLAQGRSPLEAAEDAARAVAARLMPGRAELRIEPLP
jgi:pyridoxine kinase